MIAYDSCDRRTSLAKPCLKALFESLVHKALRTLGVLDIQEGRKKAARGHEPEPPINHPPRRHLPAFSSITIAVMVRPEARGQM
jgi:hypothetical protein